jgi:hypothetical protein
MRIVGPVDMAAELKVWDIGHEIFDLAKICRLLATRVWPLAS